MTSRIDLSRYSSYDSSRAESVSTATRSESGTVSDAGHPPPVQKPVYTKEMINQAVEKVLSQRHISEEEKDIYRNLLSSDTEAGFAANYYMGKSEVKVFGHRSLDRKRINIPVVLTTQETADLVDYAPEYDLQFLDSENHDHAMAWGMRKVDTEVLNDMIPANVPFKDIGGDPMYYIMAGMTNAHVCGSLIDPKDPSRATIRVMRARRVRDDPRYSAEQRSMANRFVGGDKSFCCGLRGEECLYKAPITRSIHVYDVKMEQWPVIMENAGASLHQGCVLFPYAAYTEREGELPVARARYTVDTSKNVYSMGFKGSPSMLYNHNWLDFMRYGVDQVIPSTKGRYSYKVAQRRGDTVFFDLVRVAGRVKMHRPVYKVPGVPMVCVNGFEVTETGQRRDMATMVRQTMRRKKYWFPAPLWSDMKQQAELDFERGVMDFRKLFNYLRTIAPRNTINGVLVSGGHRVEAELMVPLVVHVGMAAAMSVLGGQHSTKGLITDLMLDRLRRHDGFLRKALRATVASIVQLGKLITWPLRKLHSLLTGMTDEALMASLIQWEHMPVVQEVSFTSLVPVGWFRDRLDWDVDGMEVERSLQDYQLEAEQSYHERAMQSADGLRRMVTILCNGEDPGPVDADGSKVSEPVSGTTAVEPERSSIDYSVQVSRRAAIQECIEESMLEEKKCAELCEEVLRMCTDGRGEPMRTALMSNAERYDAPDLWYINRGVLVGSALQLPGSDCQHSAVFTLVEDPLTGSRFRSLRDVENKDGPDYRVITDSSFTGWAVTINRLLIFNGPEIRDTLRRAIDLDHGYKVVQVQGPPGCGKTHSIIQKATEQDVIQCPVRESSRDTREKLLKKLPAMPQARIRVSTIDSYLVNYGGDSRRQALRTDALLADECFMTHSGNWYAVSALLGAQSVRAYGDSEQIPHVPRVNAPSIYPRLEAQEIEYVWLTYRCPWDAVAAWGHLYDWKVRSMSKVKKSMSVATTWRGLIVPQDELVILYMYHDTYKVLLKEMGQAFFDQPQVRHMSTHQAEGKTFKNVWLFRHDMRPRSDNMSLYDKLAYALVATSRHTDTFVYVRPVNLNDTIDRWIATLNNPRLIAAAGDVATAGITQQYK